MAGRAPPHLRSDGPRTQQEVPAHVGHGSREYPQQPMMNGTPGGSSTATHGRQAWPLRDRQDESVRQQNQQDPSALLQALSQQGFAMPSGSSYPQQRNGGGYWNDHNRLESDPVERYRRQWEYRQRAGYRRYGDAGVFRPPPPPPQEHVSPPWASTWRPPQRHEERWDRDRLDYAEHKRRRSSGECEWQAWQGAAQQHSRPYSGGDYKKARRKQPSDTRHEGQLPSSTSPPRASGSNWQDHEQRSRIDPEPHRRSRSPPERDRDRDRDRDDKRDDDDLQYIAVAGVPSTLDGTALCSILTAFCQDAERAHQDLESPTQVRRYPEGQAEAKFSKIAYAHRFLVACGELSEISADEMGKLISDLGSSDVDAASGPLKVTQGRKIHTQYSCIRVQGLGPQTTARDVYRGLASINDAPPVEAVVLTRRSAFLVTEAEAQELMSCLAKEEGLPVAFTAEAAESASATTTTLDVVDFTRYFCTALPSHCSWTDRRGQVWTCTESGIDAISVYTGNGHGSKGDDAAHGIHDGSKQMSNDEPTGRTQAAANVSGTSTPSSRKEVPTPPNGPAPATKKATTTSSKKMATDIARWTKKQAELHGGNEGGGGASGQEPPSASASFIDTDSLCCYLCTKKFKSLEILARHERESDLHKSNLADESKRRAGEELSRKKRHGDKDETKEEGPMTDDEVRYRDRALERRAIFGASTVTPAKKAVRTFEGPSTAETKLPAAKSPETEMAPTEDHTNIGNILLRSMGWTEGSGIGADGSGIDKPIEAVRYAAGAGLGSQAHKETASEIGARTQQHNLSMVDRAREQREMRYRQEGGS